MKILFANNYAYLRGGSERVLFDEMTLLAEHHIDSNLFSRQHPDNDAWKTSFFFPPHLEYEVGGLSNKLRSVKELIYSREVGSCLQGMIKQQQPDIMHAHNIYGRLTTAIFDTAKRAQLPSLLTLHDYKLICPSYLLMREGRVCELCAEGSAYQCLLKRCHKDSLAASAVYVAETYFTRWRNKYSSIKSFLCPSRFLLEKHTAGGIPREKLTLLPNAVDVSGFSPNFEGGEYALFVGRLSREKGVKTLLSAMVGLDIPLQIVGDGPLRGELEGMADREGFAGVSFAGYRSGAELAELFRNASFLIFPSEWYENAPMTILEAFGYGKPVIGADIGGIPEMIIDGETGLLFLPGDIDVLREKIDYLWSNKAKVIEMGKNARHRVETEYNSELHYKRLMAVYEKALS